MSNGPSRNPPRHLYLVDGSGFIFRAFHALPLLTRPDGTPVNAVLGFCNMLYRLLRELRADDLAVLFDSSRKSFRNEVYPEYKAHRPDPPPELVPQFALIREATRAFGVPAVELEGFEADDLIATYARQARERGETVTIVSSDKDLMQLVGDGVEMLDPIKQRRIGPAEVQEKFGVEPVKMADLQALTGDSVDNVPGVPGIGPKTAAELLARFGDLDTLLRRVDEISQPKRRQVLTEHAGAALLSRELVTLRRDVPVPASLDEFAVRPPDGPVLRAFLEAQGFRALIARLEQAAPDGKRAKAAEIALEAGTERESEPGRPSATRRYQLVQTRELLREWVARARSAGCVAFDTETTSLDAMRAELVGFSLAVTPGEACYVPVGHRAALLTDERPVQMSAGEALAEIRGLLIDPKVRKIGQNLKYDMLVLARDPYVAPIAPFDDTMLLSYALDAGLHGHGMDELATLHLGVQTISFQDVTGTGKSRISFAEVPLPRALEYAAEDADVTLQLWSVLASRATTDERWGVYETLERPLVPILVEMERAGIRVDRKELDRLGEYFAGRMRELEGRIHAAAGRSFAIGSPKQLGEVLFVEKKLAGGKKGKSGAYSTDADVLEQLAAEGHELPALVLEWRQFQKLKSTYTDALVAQINPDTGRVHTSYAMAATTTGRLSSTDPNLQNIPVRTEEGRKIRAAFVAEPGHAILSADYSQIELRLLAHVARVPSLEQAFREGQDIHALTASEMFGVPVDGMDPSVRRSAKAINFGIIYGISAFGLARQLGIPQAEAAETIARYFERYPGIRDYMERTKVACREAGWVSTLFGRRIHIPGIADRNPARRAFAERQAINAPIQGAAADVIRRAMIRMPDALREAKLDARMLLQVHDELVFEVPVAQVGATAELVRRVMEGAPSPAVELSVPLTVEVGHGATWGAAH